VWDVVEHASPVEQVKLKRDIATTISRLKGRIERRVDRPENKEPETLPLFDREEDRQVKISTATAAPPPPRFPAPALHFYDKDLADQALEHLPKIAHCQTFDEVRDYLTANLRFNSQATRRRRARYLTGRYFPGEVLHGDVPAFAAAAANTPALGEGLFYLTCRTEKIVSAVAEQIIFPSLPQGVVDRNRMRDFVKTQMPGSKSVNAVSNAIIRTYQAFAIATANRTRLNVSLREGRLVSFAYILHMEFPDPGMHAFEGMLYGPMHKWLLWDRTWMTSQLYHLREAGLLSKVSEIDRMRQFTTKYSLSDAMPRIVSLAKESPA
jgi:DNA repair protein RadC